MSKFNTNPLYLLEKLFNPIRPKQGAKTIINMTVLPDYFAYICEKLQPKEREHLSQYHLQNLLMEYATQGQKVLHTIDQEHHYPRNLEIHNVPPQENPSNLQNVSSTFTSTTRLTTLNSLDKLTKAIIQFIRGRRQYWLKRSTQTQDSQRWKAEQIYDAHMKEIEKIDTMIPEETYNNPQYYKYSNKKKIVDEYDCWKYQLSNDQQTNKLLLKYTSSVFPYMIEFVQRRGQIIAQYMKISAQLREKQQQQRMQQQIESQKNEAQQQQQQQNDQINQLRQQQIQKENVQQEQEVQEDVKTPIGSQNSQQRSNKGQSESSNKKINEEKVKKKEIYELRQIISQPAHKLCKILKQCLIYYNLKARTINSYRNAYLYSYNNRYRATTHEKSSKQNLWNIFTEWIERSENYETNKLRSIKMKALIGNKDNTFHQNMLEIMVKTADKIQKIDTFINQLQRMHQNLQENFTEIPVYIIEQDLERRHLKMPEIDTITNYFIKYYQNQLQNHIRNAQLQQKNSINIEQQQQPHKYIFHTQQQIANIKQQYEKMINDPINASLTKYKIHGSSIPWEENYYEIFLKYLKDFLKVPTNNRKIAQQMSKQLKKHIEPNHVKHAKGIYFRNMNKRIQMGQCGGGRRGRCLSKEHFIDRDIEIFNMKYFKSGRKELSKKRKIRRKKQSSEEEPAVDSEEI